MVLMLDLVMSVLGFEVILGEKMHVTVAAWLWVLRNVVILIVTWWVIFRLWVLGWMLMNMHVAAMLLRKGKRI